MLGSVALAVVAAASSAVASPLDLIKRVSPGTGTSNGFFYSFWTDGVGSVTYNNDERGSYDVTVSHAIIPSLLASLRLEVTWGRGGLQSTPYHIMSCHIMSCAAID